MSNGATFFFLDNLVSRLLIGQKISFSIIGFQNRGNDVTLVFTLGVMERLH